MGNALRRSMAVDTQVIKIRAAGWLLIGLLVTAMFNAGIPLEAQPVSAGVTREFTPLGFYRWCIGIGGLPPARCDKSLADDVMNFQNYRDELESLKTQELNHAAKDQQLDGLLDGRTSTQLEGPYNLTCSPICPHL
jgi:hypothetical protein